MKTNKTFRSGAEAQRMGIARAKTITNQPGYRRGEPMRLARGMGDPAGTVRLYVSIAGRWADGSLVPFRAAIAKAAQEPS